MRKNVKNKILKFFLLGYCLPLIVGCIGYLLIYKLKLPFPAIQDTPMEADSLKNAMTLSLIPVINIITGGFAVMIWCGYGLTTVVLFVGGILSHFWDALSVVGNFIASSVIER